MKTKETKRMEKDWIYLERLYRVKKEKIREKDTRKRAWIEEEAKSVGDE